jgi:TolB-like protein/Tfp pilus assembly protein PilF
MASAGKSARANLPSRPFRVGAFTVDPALGRITGRDGERHVEPRVMDVLVALAQRAPEPVTRDALIQAVWGHAYVTDGVVTRCISLLRQCLEADRDQPKLIETLAKRGYRLLQPPRYLDALPSADALAHRVPIAIAVLPFQNLSRSAADEYIADGLTELLLANLAGVASLRVISRTSAMVYKRTSKRVAEIASELDVTHVVEGSVLHGDDRLQVVVQLIDARTDAHLWARSYTRDLRGLLSLLNDIAAAIAHELRAALTPAEASRLAKPVAIAEDAMHAYLRARYLQAQRTADSLHKAIETFDACIRLAPDFAAAHAGCAGCYIMLAIYGAVRPVEAGRRAREYSDRACTLDPDSAEAQTSRGSVSLFFDWNFPLAAACYERALALNPSYTGTYLSYGDLKLAFGDLDGGLAMLTQAVRLDPFNLGYNMNVGDFLFFMGRFAEAAEQQLKTLHMAPHFVLSRIRLAECHAMLGRADDALRESRQALAEAPAQPRVRESHAFVLAAVGAHAQARDALAALRSEAPQRYINPWELARAYAVLGDAEAAFDWLDAACEDRAPMIVFSAIYPAFASLRAEPRFTAMLARIGLLQR